MLRLLHLGPPAFSVAALARLSETLEPACRGFKANSAAKPRSERNTLFSQMGFALPVPKDQALVCDEKRVLHKKKGRRGDPFDETIKSHMND